MALWQMLWCWSMRSDTNHVQGYRDRRCCFQCWWSSWSWVLSRLHYGDKNNNIKDFTLGWVWSIVRKYIKYNACPSLEPWMRIAKHCGVWTAQKIWSFTPLNYRLLSWTEHYLCFIGILRKAGDTGKIWKLVERIMVSNNQNIPGAIWVVVLQRTESLHQCPKLQIWRLSLALLMCGQHEHPSLWWWVHEVLKRPSREL